MTCFKTAELHCSVVLSQQCWWIKLTISRPNDTPELDVLPELDGTSGFDPAGEKFRSGKFPEQPDLAQELLAAADVDRRRSLLDAENDRRPWSCELFAVLACHYIVLDVFDPPYQATILYNKLKLKFVVFAPNNFCQNMIFWFCATFFIRGTLRPS